jgi:hypothetical protein
LILTVFVIVFLVELFTTVTLTTQEPLFTATTFPDLILQYFAEDEGTTAVTFEPLGTLRFAVIATLLNVAGLLAVRTLTFIAAGDGESAGAAGNGAT